MLTAETSGQSPLRRIRAFLARADAEMGSVVATLLFMLLGGFGAKVGLSPQLAPWFFLAAYLAGGWHGTIKGIRSFSPARSMSICS